MSSPVTLSPSMPDPMGQQPISPAEPYQGIELSRESEGLQSYHWAPDDHTQKQLSDCDPRTEGRYLQTLRGHCSHLDVCRQCAELQSSPDLLCAAEKNQTEQGTRQILGLRPRTFWIVFSITSVLVIAGVVGGVVGALMTPGDGGDPQQPGPSPSNTSTSQLSPPAVPLVGGSQLAATNWTDGDGVERKMVYFQDQHGYLIGRTWNSSSAPGENGPMWTTVNITGNLDTTPNPNLAASLAAATYVGDYGVIIDLFYQTTTTTVHRVRSSDVFGADQGTWAKMEFDDEDDRPRPQYLSQMAAVWQGCGGEIECPGFELLVVRDRNDGVTMYNSTWNNEWTYKQLNTSDELSLSTPMAMVGSRFGRTQDITYMFRGPDDVMRHVGTSDDGLYTSRSDLMTLEPTVEGFVSQLAGLKWRGGEVEMILSLQSNGTIKGFWWTGENDNWDSPDSQETFNPVIFSGYEGDEDPSWEAIATTGEGWFYGINQGRILEFYNQHDDGDHGTFHYNGIVY